MHRSKERSRDRDREPSRDRERGESHERGRDNDRRSRDRDRHHDRDRGYDRDRDRDSSRYDSRSRRRSRSRERSRDYDRHRYKLPWPFLYYYFLTFYPFFWGLLLQVRVDQIWVIQGSRISSAYLAVTPLVFLVMYNLLVCVESVLLNLWLIFFSLSLSLFFFYFFFNVIRIWFLSSYWLPGRVILERKVIDLNNL